jgi:cytochrome oxidase Cu insertion factor (SCO1/SenC/PrrC family)
MSFRREAQTAAPADQPAEASLTKQELISRYGNLIDDPMQSAPSDAAAVSVFGADPRDDTQKLVREQAEQLAVQKVQIEELTKKQAVLESGLLKYSDTRRLCDEVMQRPKSQIRLEKSRYMG